MLSFFLRNFGRSQKARTGVTFKILRGGRKERILPGTQQTSKHSRVSEAKDVWKKDVEEI